MIIALRNTETGEVRKVDPYLKYDGTKEWMNELEWFWTEGNFSCDCNRWMAFEWAADGDPDLDEAECGEGRFEITQAPWQ